MSALPVSPHIGTLWQQRMQALTEYHVVRDGNTFEAGFSDNVLFSSEYERAGKYLETLVDRYRGMAFEDLFSGRQITNEGGACFVVEHRQALPVPAYNTDRFRTRLLTDLSLVHGIGPATEKKLHARGYHSLTDLVEHPQFRQQAKQVLTCINEGDSLSVMELAGSRHSRSHPEVLGAACIHKPEDFVFMDIETLGLFSRPIILFGIGTLDDGNLVVRQYLLRDIPEEEAALTAALGHFSAGRPALVTFNGKSFDYPYFVDRLGYYGMRCPAKIPHFDVLHFSRRRWKNHLSSLRLTALEQNVLNISRDDDVPGQMVPEFYERYLRTGNPGPLIPIVEHNRQDVVSLALLFFYLLGDSYGPC
jgi:uncharacterized protein YprB with RNaseH-like and TPR domain